MEWKVIFERRQPKGFHPLDREFFGPMQVGLMNANGQPALDRKVIEPKLLCVLLHAPAPELASQRDHELQELSAGKHVI
jgi:hypothetical protein